MRVLLTIDGLGNGGAERQLALLATHLPDDVTCRVWSIDGGMFVGVLTSAGIDVRTARRTHRLDPRPIVDLWRTIRQWRPDVVHGWGWMGSLAAIPICRVLGVPFIDGTIRQGRVFDRHRWRHSLIHRLATHVVANTRAGLLANGISESRGRVIYNGFDEERLRWPARQEEGGDPNVFRVVMAARMVREKDYATYHAAAALIGRTRPDRWHFTSVGDGPMRPQILAEAEAEITSGLLSVHPSVEDVIPILSRCDVGVLMCHEGNYEGCSNSILEYMACGLPVVCSDAPSNREVVPDGACGCVVPPRDAGSLARTLCALRDDLTRSRALGAAGRARLEAVFSTDRMVSEVLTMYKEVQRAQCGT